MPPLTDSFPLVYCNGDSYSNNNYHESLRKSTYDFIVADALNGFNINNAVSGSCNRRIIRTSVADLVEQREINPSQRIIALIGLTFDMRFEFWNEKFLKKPLTLTQFSKVTFCHCSLQLCRTGSAFLGKESASKNCQKTLI
jgi:hypothetical protein